MNGFSSVSEALELLVEPFDGEPAEWEDVLQRAGGVIQPRAASCRRLFALAAAAAFAVALAVSPVGAAIAREIGDFSAWLFGQPGEPASVEEQRSFEQADQRSWASFPGSPQLRRLIRTEANGWTFELYGFRTGVALCLRLTAEGIALGGPGMWRPATSCTPLRDLRQAEAPALVVRANHGFGLRRVPRRAGPASGIAPKADATFGIVADGVDAVELVSNHGRHRALVASNAFLYVELDPPRGLRMQEGVATDEGGRRWPIPVAVSPLDEDQPLPGPGRPTGPSRVERTVTGGAISWVERREPRGESLEEARIRGPFGPPESRLEFARVIQPDPEGFHRVAVLIMDRAPPAPGEFGAPGGNHLCAFLIDRSGYGGGCSPIELFFARGPLNSGTFTEHGGDQYSVVSGLASDEVARIALFLATGERVPVPLRDNAYVVQIARAKYPARLVAYDDAGLVIGIETFEHEPLADAGPRPVRDKQRVVLTVEGDQGTKAVLRVGPSTDGGRCWRHTFIPGGGGGGGCPPKTTKMPILGLGFNNTMRELFVTGHVAERVARVEFRFQDGTTATVEPVEDFILYAIPSVHLEAGRRLEAAVARDAGGRALGRETFPTAGSVYER